MSPGCSDGRGEVLFCRLVAAALGGRRLVMQPAAASIVCSALRRWADDSPPAAAADLMAGGDEGQATGDEDDESGDRQLQVESLTALATLLRDNLAQVHLSVCQYSEGGLRLHAWACPVPTWRFCPSWGSSLVLWDNPAWSLCLRFRPCMLILEARRPPSLRAVLCLHPTSLCQSPGPPCPGGWARAGRSAGAAVLPGAGPGLGAFTLSSSAQSRRGSAFAGHRPIHRPLFY